jgi:hypothetical protein
MDRKNAEIAIDKAEWALQCCKRAANQDHVDELKNWLAEVAKYAVDALKWL